MQYDDVNTQKYGVFCYNVYGSKYIYLSNNPV